MAAIMLPSIYETDHFLQIWNYVWGYHGFITAQITTPILPWTLSSLYLSVVVLTALLLVARVNPLRALIVGILTPIAAAWMFEYTWDFFLLKPPYLSWFGYGPFLTYSFGYVSLAALWFVGIRYWKVNIPVIIVWISLAASWTIWVEVGYPNNFMSYAINQSYVLNVITKVLTFAAYDAPVVAYCWHRISMSRNLKIQKPTED